MFYLAPLSSVMIKVDSLDRRAGFSRLTIKRWLNDQAVTAWFTSTRGVYPWVEQLNPLFLKDQRWSPQQQSIHPSNQPTNNPSTWLLGKAVQKWRSLTRPNTTALVLLFHLGFILCSFRWLSSKEDSRQRNWGCLSECHPDTEIFSKRRKIYTICVDGWDAWC